MQYTCDKGNLPSVQRTNNGKTQTYGFTYDCFGNMLTAKVGSRTLATNVYTNDFGPLIRQTYGNGDVVSYTYDNLGRTKTATYDDGRVLTYVYNGEGRLHSLTETNGSSVTTYLYTYDSIGRLIYSERQENGNSVLRTSQSYNENNQLTGQNWQLGSTSYSEGYTYNSADGSLNTMTTGAGNILTASDDTATHSYTYGDTDWKDLLTGFDGQAIIYDAIGNPTSYCNGTRWAMTWENGRSLATASDGTNSLSFAYDASGLRTSKTVNGTTYRYYYAGGKLMRMSWGANILDFFYDESGLPYAMKYNGTAYYYITNLQGDVMRIVDASQNIVTSYDYDPGGRVRSTGYLLKSWVAGG